jgi:hypothetical protein
LKNRKIYLLLDDYAGVVSNDSDNLTWLERSLDKYAINNKEKEQILSILEKARFKNCAARANDIIRHYVDRS